MCPTIKVVIEDRTTVGRPIKIDAPRVCKPLFLSIFEAIIFVKPTSVKETKKYRKGKIGTNC